MKTLSTIFATLLLTVAVPSAQAQTKADLAFAKKAKEVVANVMKDPSSVQFRTLVVAKDSDGKRTLCGEVNAKNSFGAYTGFRPFYADLEYVKFMGNSEDPQELGPNEHAPSLFATFVQLRCTDGRVSVK